MAQLRHGVKKSELLEISQTERTDSPWWDKDRFNTAYDVHMKEWAILDYMVPFILYNRKGCLVEIGMGNSTFFLCKHASAFDRTLYSCDINTEKTYKLFHGHEVRMMSSEDFMEDFEENPAVVLIDGDHSYKTAKMEFDFFFEKLVTGGVIFLHDTYPPIAVDDDPEKFLGETACGDVWKLRQDLEKRRDEMDVLTWPYGAGWSGLTMILKKEKDRPYWGK